MNQVSYIHVYTCVYMKCSIFLCEVCHYVYEQCDSAAGCRHGVRNGTLTGDESIVGVN